MSDLKKEFTETMKKYEDLLTKESELEIDSNTAENIQDINGRINKLILDFESLIKTAEYDDHALGGCQIFLNDLNEAINEIEYHILLIKLEEKIEYAKELENKLYGFTEYMDIVEKEIREKTIPLKDPRLLYKRIELLDDFERDLYNSLYYDLQQISTKIGRYKTKDLWAAAHNAIIDRDADLAIKLINELHDDKYIREISMWEMDPGDDDCYL